MAGHLSFTVPEWSSCLKFGPHQNTKSLLAVGGLNKLTIKECILNDTHEDGVQSLADIITMNGVNIAQCNVGRIKSMDWSPQSTLTENNHFVRLGLVGSDNKIHLFTLDSSGNSLMEIGSHSSDINSIAFHSTEPNILATVGDDLVCKVWNVETGQVMTEFQLTSSGMAVSFHPEQKSQLLVTERSGRIRLYNLETESPILSLDCPDGTLLQSDWSISNSLKIGGVGNSNWYMWDISQSSLPYDSQTITNAGPLTNFKWCPINDNVFATLGLKGLLQIYHYEHQKVPVSCTLPVIKDICWHPSLPIALACTNNQIICFGLNL